MRCRLPCNSSAGEGPLRGIARKDDKNICSARSREYEPFNLLIWDLKVLTNRSASPFDCGWKGAVVMCSTPFALQKFENSWDVNCGPLSETSTSGNPSIQKIDVRVRMVLADVVEDIGTTNGNLLYASTTISHLVFQNGPA